MLNTSELDCIEVQVQGIFWSKHSCLQRRYVKKICEDLLYGLYVINCTKLNSDKVSVTNTM